jgi:hydroxylaminobenzene mutase
VRLSSRPKAAAYWSALYGTYGNWTVTILAAIFGTGALSPITAAGRSAQPWQESIVTFGFHPRSLGSASNGSIVNIDRDASP